MSFARSLVFPAKYRKKVFDDNIDRKISDVCIEISERYKIYFVEIGNDSDHIHMLVQSVPTLTVTRIVTVIKSITAKAIFKEYPEMTYFPRQSLFAKRKTFYRYALKAEYLSGKRFLFST